MMSQRELDMLIGTALWVALCLYLIYGGPRAGKFVGIGGLSVIVAGCVARSLKYGSQQQQWLLGWITFFVVFYLLATYVFGLKL